MVLHPTVVVRFLWFIYLFIYFWEQWYCWFMFVLRSAASLTSFSLGLLPRGLHCRIMDYLCNEVTVKAESYLCWVLCKSCCCCVQQCYGAWKICKPITVVMHWSRKELASAADEQLDGVLTRQMCVACKKTERGLHRQCGYWYKTVCTVCQQLSYPLGMCMEGMHEMPSMELIPCAGREAVAWTGFASDCWTFGLSMFSSDSCRESSSPLATPSG